MHVEETELKSESLALLIEEMKKLEVDGWKKVKQIAYIQTDKKTKNVGLFILQLIKRK